MQRVGAVGILLVVSELLIVGRPHAAECRVIVGGSPALGAIDAETRLRWLDRHLRADAARARIWAWTWRAAYSGVTVVQVVRAGLATDSGDQAADIVGAASAFIGVAANVILPLKVMGDQRWWSKHYAHAAGDDPCALLNTAELLFIRDAESEAFGVGPLTHVGNFIINIAGGLVLGLGYGRWSAFAYTSLVGIAVGEVQAATQPTDVIEDLRLYRAGQLGGGLNPPRLGVAMAPILLRDGGGLALTLRW